MIQPTLPANERSSPHNTETWISVCIMRTLFTQMDIQFGNETKILPKTRLWLTEKQLYCDA